MKHLYKICFALTAFSILIFFSNAKTGPGNAFSTGYTNAPFDVGYCNSCHGLGSYTPAISMQLLNGTTPVSTYTPNSSYTLSINISTSTGTGPKYGFQVVGVRTSNNANAGTWGTLAANHQTASIGGRTYVEHTQPLTSGSINIPWTAPPAGNGSVIFYMAGNVVNDDETPFGDNPATQTLTIPVSPLPITWLSFDGKIKNGKALLEWATTNEIGNGVFILERSPDGKNFEELTRIPSKIKTAEKNVYTYTDSEARPVNYYTIKHREASGEVSTFKTIRVNANIFWNGFTYIKGEEVNLVISGIAKEYAQVAIFSIDGRKIHAAQVLLKEADNLIKLPKPQGKGIYLIHVKNGTQVIYSDKFLVE